MTSALVWAWCLTDVGTWTWHTLTLSSMLPIYFTQLWSDHATSDWGMLHSVGATVGALLAPLVGVLADHWKCARLVLIACSMALVLFTLCLVFILHGGMADAQILGAYVVTCVILYTLATTLINGYIGKLSRGGDTHRHSAWNGIFGQCGAALAFGPLVWLSNYYTFEHLLKVACVVAAACWLLTSLPFWVLVYTTPPRYAALAHDVEPGPGPGLCQKRILLLLLSNILASDALGTLYHNAVVFGKHQLHLATHDLLFLTWINRLVSIVTIPVLLWLHHRGTSARRIYTGLLALSCTCPLLCMCISDYGGFLLLQVMLAIVGAGTYVFGRSVLAEMTPPGYESTVFGLNATMGRVTGFVGPALFSVTARYAGDDRMGYGALAFLAFLSLHAFITIPV